MIRLDTLGEIKAAAAVLAELEVIVNLLKLLVGDYDSLKYKWPVQNLRRFDIHAAELDGWYKH